MPNIGYTRSEYADLSPHWDLIRDCLAGAATIKQKGTAYLPQPNSENTSDENTARYNAYKERAVFYNVCQRTLNGLTGQVMSKDPVIEVPADLEPLVEDIDGSGVSLEQQSQAALEDVLAHSRAGLFVDYPMIEAPGATKAQLKQGSIRPTVTYWQPWDIINWRVRLIGGQYKLSMVVLTEMYVTDDDGFEEELDDLWKVLLLNESGQYMIQEWIRPNLRREDESDSWELRNQWTPLNAKGQPFDHIPFVFLGAKNNSEHPDLPLMYDLASLNIAHYRNSADYEDSCYLTGQPTPVFAGLTDTWVRDVLKGKVYLGSRAAIPLPEGGSASLLQAAPNSMPFEAMEHKEKQMVALGAKLVENRKVERTLGEANLDKIGENSILSTVTKNVSAGYEMALQFAEEFISTSPNPDAIVYELNTDFEIHTMAPDEQQALMALWQGQAIVEEEMRDKLRKAGLAYLDDEDYKAIKATEAPVLELGGPMEPEPKEPAQ